MRMISNEELAFVAGGSYLDEKEPSIQPMTASDFASVSVNFSSLNNYQVAVAIPTPLINPYNNAPMCPPGTSTSSIAFTASGSSGDFSAAYKDGKISVETGGRKSTWEAKYTCEK